MAGRFFGETRDWVAVLWQNDLAARTHLLTMTLTFFVKQPGGFYRRFEEQHVQRAHSAQEILAWLGEAGFAHAHVFGDQHFEPPGSTERRIHFAALK